MKMCRRPHFGVPIPSGWLICILSVCYVIPASDALAAPANKKGFGSIPTSSTTKTKNGQTTTTKTKKKQKRGGGEGGGYLEELRIEPQRTFLEQQKVPPELDKWGLPPPTLDDIFPPLSNDVQMVPARVEGDYNLTDLQEVLNGYLTIDIARLWETCNVTLVHESPPVLVLDDFLTAEECREIQQIAGLLVPTTTRFNVTSKPNNHDIIGGRPPVQIQSTTMSPTLAQSVRTSTSWFCHYESVSTLLIKMEELMGIQLSTVEEPQIVQYRPHQEFSWHYDHLPTTQIGNGGQRIATFLIYLNDCSDAPTVFRDLQDSQDSRPLRLSVVPKTGRALLFFPATADGQPDERTLHCGMPAITNEKHLIQCWIHQSVYRAALPPGNQQSHIDRVTTRRRLGYE